MGESTDSLQGDRPPSDARILPAELSFPFRPVPLLLPTTVAAAALLGFAVARMARGRETPGPARALRKPPLEHRAAVFDQSGEAIVIADQARRIQWVNPAFTFVTGYPPAEAVGRAPDFLGADAADAGIVAALFESRAGHRQGEVQARRRDGEVFPLWLAVTATHDGRGRFRFIAIGSDISERKTAEERIQFLAHHDMLTGLPNRILMRDRLEQVLAHVQRARSRAAVLFLDLDQFKQVNDSLGHPAGDELLKQVAERLRACVRMEDTISRRGGDEFLLVLGDLRGTEDAARVARKIGEVIARPFLVEGHEIRITTSIGIAMAPEAGAEGATLIRHADAAMYDAKASGRNAFRFFAHDGVAARSGPESGHRADPLPP